ncbi:HAD family acid phosphatase [Tsukamurella strandjordii]|uniref:HAD family acid phosphatase n=2 Tax=Tsukamurella strandjordii TaxID=147577 RepID=A0AA90NDG4_9ACTN|nr:HAD family acid phosphatase [Tsukamurella strandjordii]MDP0396416.1 HAD family acid phosphatase [Tsukamurella strandjordii]
MSISLHSRAVHRLAATALVVAGATMFTPAAAHAELPSYATWRADVKAAMSGGTAWLDQRKAQGGERLAIVLDIDNTALQTDYRPGTATPEVLEFARHAKDIGFSVLFASYRTSADSATSAVTAVGYPVDAMCPRTPREARHATDSKQACRQKYVSEGYTITANVGNRPGDFTGGNYEKAFKLPDYNETLQ